MPRLLALAGVVALAAAPGSAREPEVVLPTSNAVTTEIVEARPDYYRRMTVPVTIEGKGPFRFMIDTGAQATVVTRELSEQLGLPTIGKATLVGMASRAPVTLVRLDGLEFAARTFDNISAPLLEAQHIGADGILGLDSLQNLRVLIDFRSGEIKVDDAEELGGNRGYDIVVRARRKLGRLIITNADVDGVRTAVIIDTGAQGSMGNLALQERLRAKSLRDVTATDVLGNEIVGQGSRVGRIRIDRLQLNQVPVAFADAPAFEALGLSRRPALVLGMEALRLFDRVAIDFASRKVLFDMPEDAGWSYLGSGSRRL